VPDVAGYARIAAAIGVATDDLARKGRRRRPGRSGGRRRGRPARGAGCGSRGSGRRG
jgi:hypothetical protein